MLPVSLKNSPRPLYLLTSNEPLLIRDWLDQARATLRNNGFEDIQTLVADTGFDWRGLLEESDMLSLFASKKCRVVTIKNGKPGQQGGKIIQSICDQPPGDVVFIFVTPALDKATKKSSWFKGVAAAGEIVELAAINYNQLAGWIMQRSADKTLVIDSQAAAFLAERTEGNLLAADQELEKLALRFAGKEAVTFDEVEQSVGQSSRYSHFALVDACLGGRTKRALKILASLRAEGYVSVQLLWALQSSLEHLACLKQAQSSGRLNTKIWQELRIWSSKQQLYTNALNRLKPLQIERLLRSCATLDRINKGQQDNDFPDSDWLHLKSLVGTFSGHEPIPNQE